MPRSESENSGTNPQRDRGDISWLTNTTWIRQQTERSIFAGTWETTPQPQARRMRFMPYDPEDTGVCQDCTCYVEDCGCDDEEICDRCDNPEWDCTCTHQTPRFCTPCGRWDSVEHNHDNGGAICHIENCSDPGEYQVAVFINNLEQTKVDGEVWFCRAHDYRMSSYAEGRPRTRKCFGCSKYYDITGTRPNLTYLVDNQGQESELWPVCKACEPAYERACRECGDYLFARYRNTFCEPCWGDKPPMARIMNYSYVPEPLSFHAFDLTTEFFVGLEIESNFHDSTDRDKMREWLGRATNYISGELLYGKEDSSINNGIEVVTHPMNPDWALENFPFDLFQEGIDNYGLMKTHPSCGTHMHFSKKAFTSSHLWKFLQLHLRLSEFCGIIGGRGTNAGYGSFADGDRLREKALDIAKTKNLPIGHYGRGAINLAPANTVELRYMRGDSNPKGIRKNLEWAKALYEFTDEISVFQVRKGVLNDPGFLLSWIQDKPVTYPNLINWIDQSIPSPKPMPTEEVV
jgi:hypothetical protein